MKCKLTSQKLNLQSITHNGNWKGHIFRFFYFQVKESLAPLNIPTPTPDASNQPESWISHLGIIETHKKQTEKFEKTKHPTHSLRDHIGQVQRWESECWGCWGIPCLKTQSLPNPRFIFDRYEIDIHLLEIVTGIFIISWCPSSQKMIKMKYPTFYKKYIKTLYTGFQINKKMWFPYLEK